MIAHSPSVAALLADLTAHGIELESLGGRLRYRPRSAMSPELLKRLQEQKAELLKWMDLTELRRFIDGLWRDQAWIAAWERRLRTAEYANLQALRRVLALVLELAQQHHEQRNWQAFDSTRNYLYRLASGEEWEKAAQAPPI